MAARNEHIDDIIDVYALGALEPSEQDIADDHLRGCARCRAMLDESKRVVAALAWTPDPHEPPAELRARVMARAQQVRPASIPAPAHVATPPVPKAWWRQLNGPVPGRTPLLVRRAIGIGALLLLLALAGNTVRLQDQIRQTQSTTAAQQQTIVALQGQIQQTQKAAAAQQQIVDAVRAPGTRVVAFSGTGVNIRSQLVVNAAGNQAFLLADGLPVLPPDKSYELWLIQGQKPVASNVFQVDQRGSVILQVQVPTQLKDYQAAAITVEQAAGSPTPTTKPFLVTQF